jgi:hypothetical protein
MGKKLHSAFSFPALGWAFIACALLRFLATIPFVVDDDEAWWTVSARWLKRPWDFYTQAPDDKTPGSVWFDWVVHRAFGQLGSDPRVVRAFYIVLTLGCALLLGKISARFIANPDEDPEKRQAFWLTSLLFLLFITLPSPKLLAFTGDGLMTLLVICSYALALFSGGLWSRVVALLLSGVCLAGALLVKQTAIFAALPLLFSRYPRQWKASELALILAGALLILIPSIWALGPSEMFYWVWTYPREILVSVRGGTFASSAELFSNVLVFVLSLLPLLLASLRFRTRSAMPLFDLRIQWLIAGILVVFVGKGLFLHYFLMLAPPLALILTEVYRKSPARTWVMLWLGAEYSACCILVTVPALQVTWGTDLPYFSKLNDALSPALAPAEPVLVWGGSALPLAYSHARPVTRFILPRNATAPYGTKRLHQMFVDELDRDPPALVIDLHERGDNRFGNPLESEPAVAELVRGYHLYVAPGVPWAKLYFRSAPPENSGLVEVRSSEMKAQIYESFPSVNPAWKPFESLAQIKPSLTMFREIERMESALRLQYALELIALDATDPLKRAKELELARNIHDADDERTRDLAVIEASAFLARSPERWKVLPLNTPEWWFTVSLSQMQPRISP